MLAVTGFSFRGVRGVLRDYHRGTIRGEVYPGIVPRRGEVVEGLVYRDLPEEAWKRLDAFEGEMYCRTDVGIEQAQTYVVRPEFEQRVGAAPCFKTDFSVNPFGASCKGKKVRPNRFWTPARA